MAVVAMPQQPVSAIRDEVMDTRTPSPVQRTVSQDSAEDAYKPDLSAEVAMLSTKLVNAINYQTNLDDSLQQSRHELESAQKELARLRQHKKETDEMIANGLLVRRSAMEKEMAKMRDELAKECAARQAAEAARRQGEGELESLTTALFEEANTMVAAARKDTEAEQKRASQLRTQLRDSELLLSSQQEQLQDLKGVMEKMERVSEHESTARDSSLPSTPVHSTTNAWDAVQFSPGGIAPPEIAPDHPLHFAQLLVPVLRNDIQEYSDFQDLMNIGRRNSPHSRQGSSSQANLSSASMTNLATTSSPSLPGAFSFGGSSSANNSPSSGTFSNASVPPLKESKFYKRTLLEDIEPTLRLDLAPGLSFLSRRTVLSSLLNGSLVVEPFSAQTKFYGPVFACALCGEQRKKEPYVRKHRFRTSEEESSQRYPLCDYCLGRVRAAGDFVGFLRMVRDGHWRADSEEEQKGSWEEAVRLRERMFWARLGGGVVPAVRREQESPESVRAMKSARASLESIPERRATQVSVVAGGSAKDETDEAGEETVLAVQRPVSGIGAAIVSASSGVLSTARPDVSPQAPTDTIPSEGDATAETGPEVLPGPFGGEQDEDEATTPFEDAQMDSQAEQAEASEQLQREAQEQLPTPAAIIAEPEETVAPIPAIAEPAADTAAPELPELETTTSRELATPAPAHERRPSAVLARVKAMEARAQASASEGRSTSPVKEKKLPGAFE